MVGVDARVAASPTGLVVAPERPPAIDREEAGPAPDERAQTESETSAPLVPDAAPGPEAAAPEEPKPSEAAVEDENRPAATPVFGHMHYMGEDRWTQRPQP